MWFFLASLKRENPHTANRPQSLTQKQKQRGIKVSWRPSLRRQYGVCLRLERGDQSVPVQSTLRLYRLLGRVASLRLERGQRSRQVGSLLVGNRQGPIACSRLEEVRGETHREPSLRFWIQDPLALSRARVSGSGLVKRVRVDTLWQVGGMIGYESAGALFVICFRFIVSFESNQFVQSSWVLSGKRKLLRACFTS